MTEVAVGTRVRTAWQPTAQGWRQVAIGEGVEGVVVDCHRAGKNGQHCALGPRVEVDASTITTDIAAHEDSEGKPTFHPGGWGKRGHLWDVKP